MVAARRCQRRRSSFLVHIHVVGGEATRAALTVMRVLRHLCVPGSSRTISSRPVLGRVIRRADIGGHTQQSLITVGDDTIVEPIDCVRAIAYFRSGSLLPVFISKTCVNVR